MMTVEKMTKVVSEINRGLAGSRPQGAKGGSQAHKDPDFMNVNVFMHFCLHFKKLNAFKNTYVKTAATTEGEVTDYILMHSNTLISALIKVNSMKDFAV